MDELTKAVTTNWQKSLIWTSKLSDPGYSQMKCHIFTQVECFSVSGCWEHQKKFWVEWWKILISHNHMYLFNTVLILVHCRDWTHALQTMHHADTSWQLTDVVLTCNLLYDNQVNTMVNSSTPLTLLNSKELEGKQDAICCVVFGFVSGSKFSNFARYCSI